MDSVAGQWGTFRPMEDPDDPDGYFGESVAATYDDPDHEMFQAAAIDPAVDVLAELAGQGRALELAIGTGRIALPLARRGVPVHGIDMSRAMVARLRAKPGGAGLPVTFGDFATTRVEGSFSVAYLVFNTIMNLTTQDAQVDCFRNAAAHLAPGGCFVIEVACRPAPAPARPGRRAVPREPHAVGLRPVRRRHPGHELELHRGHRGPRLVPAPSRSGTSGRPSWT